jgi:hypothetical protein
MSFHHIKVLARTKMTWTSVPTGSKYSDIFHFTFPQFVQESAFLFTPSYHTHTLYSAPKIFPVGLSISKITSSVTSL